MKAAHRYFRWQAKLADAELGRRVLEVGCGIGNFSDHLIGRELVLGIDADQACLAHWRERFSGRAEFVGLQLNAEHEEVRTLKKYNIDSIACLNVLEHVERHDLALRNMWEVLTSGGRVVLMVPAFEFLYGEIDRRLGHYRRYTRQSLAAVAEGTGFRVRRLRYMNAVGFFGWWANAKVFHRSEQSSKQIEFFDCYVVPIQSRMENLMAPPFGQSILAVLEKSVVK